MFLSIISLQNGPKRKLTIGRLAGKWDSGFRMNKTNLTNFMEIIKAFPVGNQIKEVNIYKHDLLKGKQHWYSL